MAIRYAVALVWLLIITSEGFVQEQGDELKTVAEKSNFEATSKYVEVVELCKAISKASPMVRYMEFGKTVEGRTLPLMILADPPIQTPAEAKKSGKAIVFSFANIHAGEVDGKEAMLMLARELGLAKDKSMFQHVIFMVAPIYNADGNERFKTTNRPGQVGPTKGMGIRENAEGFDLNRDFVKLETPEGQSLVKLINDWNPHIVIDCHTTNGSYHRHTITYDCSKHPATDAELVKFCVDKMMPNVTERLDKKGGWKSFYYGNFNRDRTHWETYGMQPRYSTQYLSMRNQIGILSESYSYASFKDRILATKDFVHSILDFAHAHKEEVVSKVARAMENCVNAGPDQKVPLKLRLVPMPGRYTILGWAEELKDGRRVRTDVPKDYPVTYVGGTEVTSSVARPFAYVFPATYKSAALTLQRHGIQVKTLDKETEVDVELSMINKLTKNANVFQKHRMVQADAEIKVSKEKLHAGSYVVHTRQPLGTLASFLLEAKSEDGLITWNYFDEGLEEGEAFAVYRLPNSVELVTSPIQP